MVGKYASQVKFIYEGIISEKYTRDQFENWKANMKEAISEDCIVENISLDNTSLEVVRRYASACEEVIVDLIFWSKYKYLT